MTITDRMQEVLQGITDGLTNKEIGAKLGISSKTVEKHREKLYAEFKVDNSVSLVVAAIRAKAVKL